MLVNLNRLFKILFGIIQNVLKNAAFERGSTQSDAQHSAAGAKRACVRRVCAAEKCKTPAQLSLKSVSRLAPKICAAGAERANFPPERALLG